MLVIARKVDESVELLIDGEVIATIKLLKSGARRASLGIEASNHVKIRRTSEEENVSARAEWIEEDFAEEDERDALPARVKGHQ